MAIDVAVMEKTEMGSVLPLDAGWSDVASWSALWKTQTNGDAQGKVLQGQMIVKGSNYCCMSSEHRLVMKNLILLEIRSAVLIKFEDPRKQG